MVSDLLLPMEESSLGLVFILTNTDGNGYCVPGVALNSCVHSCSQPRLHFFVSFFFMEYRIKEER